MQSPRDLDSPHSSRGGSTPSYSPRSPIYDPAQDMSKSPRERLEDLLSTEGSKGNREGSNLYTPQASKSSPLTATKEGTYHQLRNVSAPIPTSTIGGGSKKQYPAEMASSIARVGTDIEPRFVPRTSSIDSTMSTVSSATSYSYNTQDQLSPNASEVAQAISAAGSAEAAVHALLKKEKQSATQNAQLWRLVNKQRTLVLGLNKDLDRALQDKERYRKKLRELMAQPLPPPVAAIEPQGHKHSPPRSASPTDSDSPDELPIQRHSVRESVPSKLKGFDRTSVKTVEEITSPPASSSSTTSLPSGSDGRQTPLQGTGQVDAAHAIRDGIRQQSERFEPKSTAHGRITPLKPLEIHKKIRSSPEDKASPTSPELDKSASRGSFTARRSITTTTPRKSQQSPLFDTTPHAEDFPVPSPARKAPPAPLTLHRPGRPAQQPEKLGTEDRSDSDYEDIEVDEIPAFERGRRKTREDDDREREIALLKEQESRSLSKKSKRSKSATEKMMKEAPPPIQALPKSPLLPTSAMIRSFSPDEPSSEMQRHLSPPTSLAGVLSRPPSSTNSHSISERSLISPFPLSPGLPLSPRPIDRPVNSPPPRLPREGANVLLASPPLSPRIGPVLPLSPRPPRREIPLPPQTPTSLVSPMPKHIGSEETLADPPHPKMQSPPEFQRNGVSSESDPSSPRPWLAPTNSGSGGICRGLVSDSYPDLLLPPNALPSILVKVTSSRLKPSRPSRHSIISSKESEEPVFTLGISARSDFRQLWRVERATTSLPHLDQRLKKMSSFNAPLPERSLFTGHAPAKVDGRRIAIEKYFEAVLDTPMNEEAALLVCQYLSAQAIDAEDHDAVGRPDSTSPVSRGPDGRIIKEGYLTKRGKNFGGWKARFFVLDEPSLRYYESPGGPLLGTIKLVSAQIGRQTTQHSTQSPSRAAEDSDKEFRHAFLILEPKRNNSSSLVRHVLCAESDEERDDWVNALLEYVQPWNAERSRPPVTKSDSASSKLSSIHSKHQTSTIEEEEPLENTSSDPSDALQAVSYEDTAPAPAPANMPLFKKRKDKEPTSPVPNYQNLTISGPSNANIIQDASVWGNKAPDSPRTQGKEQKKRSIWGNFRADKASSEALANSLNDHPSESTSLHNDQPSLVYEASMVSERPAITRAPLYHRAVFGIPLVEAVDIFAAMGSDSGLPSVVFRCLEYLEAKQGVKEQGIFRVSGGTVLMRNLETRFNAEGDVNLLAIEIEPDVHAIAGLLKTYFRKLPTPVLPPEVHMEIVYASSRCFLSLESHDRNSRLSALANTGVQQILKTRRKGL